VFRIREIAEDELQKLVAVSQAAMPREETGGVAGFVDWKRQAEGHGLASRVLEPGNIIVRRTTG